MKNVVILFCLLCLVACGSSSTSVGNGAYTVSGTITEGVMPFAPLSGATVTLSGDGTGTATTDANGNYSFSVHNGSYTVTPAKTGYTFTPASLSATVSNADATGQNFTAVVNTYGISGTVTVNGTALAGVTVNLTGDATGTTTTDASGNYSFTGKLIGSYTVTPTIGGYTIYPASLPVTVSNANVSGKNFTTRFRINGTGTGNGTVTDNTTGLVWLQDANCTQTAGGIDKGKEALQWADANTWAGGLASGTCGLTDGSSAGNWRVPTKDELLAVSSGTEQVIFGDPMAFSNVQGGYYWSSSSLDTLNAWYVDMYFGGAVSGSKSRFYGYVWPVRSGL